MPSTLFLKSHGRLLAKTDQSLGSQNFSFYRLQIPPAQRNQAPIP
ncbi:unnamed protein product, partial [Cuscuta campestris]